MLIRMNNHSFSSQNLYNLPSFSIRTQIDGPIYSEMLSQEKNLCIAGLREQFFFFYHYEYENYVSVKCQITFILPEMTINLLLWQKIHSITVENLEAKIKKIEDRDIDLSHDKWPFHREYKYLCFIQLFICMN